jgi:5-formyltetrahydrofolate cyclo-ligase
MEETNLVSTPINMHAARTALNRDPEVRAWAEQWLKDKERAVQPAMSDEEFDKHWLYVRPERMHEGAIEAVTAFNAREEK